MNAVRNVVEANWSTWTPVEGPISQYSGEPMRQRKSRTRHNKTGNQEQHSDEQLYVLSLRDISIIRSWMALIQRRIAVRGKVKNS